MHKKDLPNAIALNSIQFNLARVFGPLLAGTTLAAFGAAACFGLNGLSFLVVIVALMSLHVKHLPPAERKPMLQEMKGGFAYARSEPSIIALTVLASLTTFLGLPLLTFLPVFARDIFHGDVGALQPDDGVLGRRRGRRRAGRRVARAVPAHGADAARSCRSSSACSSSRFALSRVFWLSNLLLFVAGACAAVVFSMTASLVQLIVPDHLRGRVMSIYMVAFRGGMPLGSLAGGYAASLTSAPYVLAVNGGLVSLVAIYFLIRSHGVRSL